MKEWAVDYSLKMQDGEIREGRISVTAASIEEAIVKGNKYLADLEVADRDIDDTAIWDVGIICEPEDLETVFL